MIDMHRLRLDEVVGNVPLNAAGDVAMGWCLLYALGRSDVGLDHHGGSGADGGYRAQGIG